MMSPRWSRVAALGLLAIGAAAARPARAEPERPAAFFLPGAVGVDGGRLHFNGSFTGIELPEHEMPDYSHDGSSTTWKPESVGDSYPIKAVLKQRGKLVASINVMPSVDRERLFPCVGMSWQRGGETISWWEDCAFALPGAGAYTIELVYRGDALATLDVSVVAVPQVGAEPGLHVSPASRRGAAFVEYDKVVYWHAMDPRDPVQVLQFVWLRGGKVELASDGIARSRPLWEDGTPLRDVAIVFGSARHDDLRPDDRLLVFLEGDKLLGAYALDRVAVGAADHVLKGLLRTASDVPAAATKLARAEAARRFAGSAAPGDDLLWTGGIVCAVLGSERALAALRDYVANTNMSGWSAMTAVESDAAAGWTPNAEHRRHLKRRAKHLRQGARASDSRAGGALRRLMTLGNKQGEACLKKSY
jgi:hypothetical protein